MRNSIPCSVFLDAVNVAMVALISTICFSDRFIYDLGLENHFICFDQFYVSFKLEKNIQCCHSIGRFINGLFVNFY